MSKLVCVDILGMNIMFEGLENIISLKTMLYEMLINILKETVRVCMHERESERGRRTCLLLDWNGFLFVRFCQREHRKMCVGGYSVFPFHQARSAFSHSAT